jgi:6-phosphogluconolactonase
VDEVDKFAGLDSGGVGAYAIDSASGRLTLLNQQPSGGTWPCRVTVDSGRKYLLVANYGGGSVCVLPILADGHLSEPSDVIQHHDTPANSDSARAPHVHSVTIDPTGRFAVAADLGLDALFVYRFDRIGGKLVACDPPSVRLASGSGPRHMAFDAGGVFAYVINELNSTVVAFGCEREAGRLTELQTISTLPDDFTGENAAAEMQIHPTGKYLYCSNRGHDSTAAYSIDAQNGMLTSIQRQPSGGQTPRHFGIAPTGQHLVVANQDSDSLVVFRIDPASGRLSPTGSVAEVPCPVCVQFAPAGP